MRIDVIICLAILRDGALEQADLNDPVFCETMMNFISFPLQHPRENVIMEKLNAKQLKHRIHLLLYHVLNIN